MRGHLLFGGALLAAALLRLVAMLGYRPAIWFDGDSYSYVAGALQLWPSRSRSSGYSLFLWLLEPFHSTALVVAAQHLLGLLSAVLVYAVLRRHGLPGWGATLLAAPVLFDAYQIQLEHMVMADTLFTALLVAAAAILLWRPALTVPWGLAAGLLLGCAAVLRTVGVPLLVVAVACLLLRRVGWRGVAAASAAMALPLGAYATWYRAEQGSFALSSADGTFLWARTMSFADCATIEPPPSEAWLCPTEPVDRRVAASRYIWSPGSPVRDRPMFTDQANELTRAFALRAIAAQPFDYLATVLGDTVKAFAWTRLPHPSAAHLRAYEFAATRTTPPTYRVKGDLRADAIARDYEEGRPGTEVVRPYAGAMVVYQRWARMPGPLLAVLLGAGLAGVVLRRGWRLGVLTAWAMGAGLLLAPAMTADFDHRYVLAAVPFAALAAGLTLARGGAPGRAARDRAGPDTGADLGKDAGFV
ncbi:hypothetical protein Ssi03_08920 [Sphaerisporangium siamense]|uniref:Nitrate reductase gamma subunit n=1 Tax=Sphaerisporangium siamense TaxID=795645 RepID=A0A7W7GDK9_9ACTN|nr:hypothetical protein [Sphaerisporangium siamense]MBB4705712.1 nitrate reductase gamma subunit [Sphaerisporangium siamense]GII82902.1 hypothetical protein Ssi03_08920 [Sphaerisporangium siamense]